MDKTPYLKFKNIYVIPTFHSRIEFAKLVRTAFFQVFPDLIAVELPDNVKEEVSEGIERLPYLSLIAYADSLNPKKMNFIPIDPGDSIIEGVKIGLEYKIPIEFVDLSVTEYMAPMFELPDDYALNKIGLNSFYQNILKIFKNNNKSKKIFRKEEINIEEFLKDQNLENASEKYDYAKKDVLREKYMASHLLKLMPMYNRILFIVGMAHWENIESFLKEPETLQDVKLDLIPYKFVKIYNINSSDARFLLRELPYNTYKWLEFKNLHSKEALEKIESPEVLFNTLNSFNKIDLIKKVFLSSKRKYEEEYKEFIDLHKLKTLFQYSRNISLVDQRLLPNLTHLLLAAKNIVDDDYAWKVYEKAIKYPYDDKTEKYETMKLSVEGGYDPNGRYIKLRRRHPYGYGSEKEIPLKKRPKEKYEGEWREEWDASKWNTVSYPPEDIIEEDYFAYVRNKALKNLKKKRIKIEEFKSSLMDGIAIKETIRNWAFKKKIFVRNEQQIQGKIDTLIVIFDKDNGPKEKYPFKLTWWAEHDKESDMAFYATNPGNFLIGPGISHLEIGGLLSIFPAPHLREVFRTFMNYEYRDTLNKAERLLKAGILHSKEKYIVYIAEEPPRKYFYSLAGVKSREIVFIPLNNLSQESLKTIKHIHVLAGKDKRKIAHKYIFLKK